jgi:hypothetical protein
MSKCLLHVNNKHQKLIAENQSELSAIFEDLKKMRERANTPEGFSRRVKEYLKEIHEDKIKQEADEVVNMIKSEANFNRVLEMRKQGVPVAEAIRTFLTPSTYNADNAGVSIAPIATKQTIKYTNLIEQGTTHAEKKILAKGSLDEEIILEMVGGVKEGDVINPTSKKIAGIFRKILDMTHADKMNVGIMLNKIQNYVFNQTLLHDADKLRGMDPEAWIDMQFRDLDHDKSFPYMNTVEEKREYLRKVYDGILERDDEAAVTNWDVLKEKGILTSAVQAKYAKMRALHYTPEGLVNQFKTFSDKPLVEVMLAEVAKSARDTAIYDVLGPRGTVAMDTIVQKVQRSLRKELHAEADPVKRAVIQKELDAIDGAKIKYLQDIAQINNTNNKVRAKNKGAKAAWEAGRTLVNTMVLGNVPLSAVTDLAWGVTAQQINTDKGYLHSVGRMLRSIMENVPAERRARLVSQMRIAQESMLGHMLRVEGADSYLTKFSAKLNYAYSTILPVQWQTRLHRTWSANIIGEDLGHMVGKKFSDLNELEVQGFKKAGIYEADWEALGMMADDLGPEYAGAKMVSSENIVKISDEAAKVAIAKHKTQDPKFLPKTPDQYRAHLEKRLDAYIEDYMTTAVPMPGERARAFLHGIGEAGEKGHELRKTLTMLKSFAVHQYALMQKVSRASQNKGTKARHLSGMVTGLIAMAYARDVIESMMTGEDLPDPTDIKTVKKAVLRSGAGTILADIALGESYGGQENSLKNLVAGPALAKGDDALRLMKRAATGKLTSKDAKKAMRLLPGNNLMYFKLLNHHIIEDAAAAMDD